MTKAKDVALHTRQVRLAYLLKGSILTPNDLVPGKAKVRKRRRRPKGAKPSHGILEG